MRRLIVLLVLASALMAGSAQAHRASAGPFAGKWGGHTRELDISSDGTAKEVIYDGCCTHALTMFLRLSNVGGGAKDGHADVTVTKITHLKESEYDKQYPAPKVGQTGTFRLHAGVIKESVTGTNYCNDKAGNRGACGA